MNVELVEDPALDPRRPRDAQRSRVYRAESAVPSSPLPGLPACAAFCDRVVGSLWWAARFPACGLDAIPRLRPGNGARQAFYREDPGGPTITLPRRYRTKGVVLHELVHWALAREHELPYHGSTFTRVLLDAYEEHKVRVGKPPVSSEHGLRYGDDERVRLAKRRSTQAA